MANTKDSTLTSEFQANSTLARRYVYLIERLIELAPDIDVPAFVDTLDGSRDEEDAWAETLRSALDDEAMIEGLRPLIDARLRRLARLEAQAKAKRQVILENMQRESVGKLRTPEFLATLVNAPPGVVIQDEALIPQKYIIRRPVEFDLDELLKDLKQGIAVPGAAIGPSRLMLNVRIR